MKENLRETLTFSPYMYEQLAGKGGISLQIASTCNAHCFYCSNNQNPFKIKRLGFRPVEEIRKAVHFVNRNAPYVAIGDALPGRISEGEALLHPDLFEILKIMRQQLGVVQIQITTNGILLDYDMICKLSEFLPIKITISYPVHNSELWQKIYGLKKEQWVTASSSFDILKRFGFAVETFTTPLPAMVGYDRLEETVEFLKDRSAHQGIYFPGYTKLTPPEAANMMEHDPAELSAFYKRMISKYKTPIRLYNDPDGPLGPSGLTGHIERIMDECRGKGFGEIWWFFSEAGYKKCAQLLQDYSVYYPETHKSFCVDNHTYGGNITCSGLLMCEDLKYAIKGALCSTIRSPSVMILPKHCFDRFDDDLMGNNLSSLLINIGSAALWLR